MKASRQSWTRSSKVEHRSIEPSKNDLDTESLYYVTEACVWQVIAEDATGLPSDQILLMSLGRLSIFIRCLDSPEVQQYRHLRRMALDGELANSSHCTMDH